MAARAWRSPAESLRLALAYASRGGAGDETAEAAAVPGGAGRPQGSGGGFGHGHKPIRRENAAFGKIDTRIEIAIAQWVPAAHTVSCERR